MNLRDYPATEEKGAVQLALRGMWTEACEGCPNRVKYYDVARCSENEMRPCIYELAEELHPQGCASFKEVIHEWQEYYHIYPYESDYYRGEPISIPIGGRLL